MSKMPEGWSLELYFIDGQPDGMLTAEVFNWTGHILKTPRTRIAEALSRPECSYTGVYLLLGDQDGDPSAYVGEGEDIGERIRNHDTRKDWWDIAVVVTSAANSLNKAHARYLEARLVEEARGAARVKLDNGTTPARPGLSEAARSNMEAFLAYLFMVLPALRIDMFMRNTRPPPDATSTETAAPTARFVIDNKKRNLKATAVLRDGEFIVEAGSSANLNWNGKNAGFDGYKRLHDTLKKSGVLREEGEHCVFTQNYAFNSPSAASSVVNGRPSSGPAEWRLADGTKSYGEWEAAQLENTRRETP